jgi:DNA-binding HxlR family transcriptional regulator
VATQRPYGMICPITRACDVLEPRWTIPILVSLWAGETRFNDLRRSIGSISPGLLSRRLKEMEEKGLVTRIEDRAAGSVDYIRTDLAIALEPVLDGLAKWAQQGLEAEFALCTAKASVLMWKIRRLFNQDALPKRRVVLRFHFNEDLPNDTYWAVISPDAPVEICTLIPGFDIDLFIETTTVSLLGIVLGRTTVARELELGTLFLSGDSVLARTMDRWLSRSAYADFGGIQPLPDRRQPSAVVAARPMRPAQVAC